jgi:hypothetical protein
VGGQHHAPAALPPGKTRYPLYRRLGGPQHRCVRVRKISPQSRFDPRTVQPVVSRYNDRATRPTIRNSTGMKYRDILSTSFMIQFFSYCLLQCNFFLTLYTASYEPSRQRSIPETHFVRVLKSKSTYLL